VEDKGCKGRRDEGAALVGSPFHGDGGPQLLVSSRSQTSRRIHLESWSFSLNMLLLRSSKMRHLEWVRCQRAVSG
jgi:hypothetical protein